MKLTWNTPWFKPKGQVIDTLVIARAAFPDIKSTDYGRFRNGILPGRLIGKYSLEAWGYRMGEFKGDFGKQDNAWEIWTPQMTEYCVQDVKVTWKLYERLKKNRLAERTEAPHNANKSAQTGFCSLET